LPLFRRAAEIILFDTLRRFSTPRHAYDARQLLRCRLRRMRAAVYAILLLLMQRATCCCCRLMFMPLRDIIRQIFL